MGVRKVLKKQFIPNQENDFAPYFLRGKNSARILVFIAVLFFGYVLQTSLLQNSNFLAEIAPKVLADLANETRVNQSIAALAINENLTKAARLKAEDMAKKSYFAHVSPEGTTPWQWFMEAGYRFAYAGENLAVDFSESEAVNNAWLNSPAHKANILNGHFTEVGIATAKGFYQGRETVFVVQMFGAPLAKNVLVSPPVVKKAGNQTAAIKPQNAVSLNTENNPSVAGETAKLDILPLYAENNFLAVKNITGHNVVPSLKQDENTEDMVVANSVSSLPYASFLEKLFLSPGKILQWIYVFLSVVIIMAIILNIFIEIRRQNPLHISYGVILLFLMFALLYFGIEQAVYRVAVL